MTTVKLFHRRKGVSCGVTIKIKEFISTYTYVSNLAHEASLKIASLSQFRTLVAIAAINSVVIQN